MQFVFVETLDNNEFNIFIFQALNGFLIMMTQGGKLLYISDNAAEYLGHSMVRSKMFSCT